MALWVRYNVKWPDASAFDRPFGDANGIVVVLSMWSRLDEPPRLHESESVDAKTIPVVTELVILFRLVEM